MKSYFIKQKQEAYSRTQWNISKPAITCLMLTIETQELDVKNGGGHLVPFLFTLNKFHALL